MDAPVKELERLRALQAATRERQEAGDLDDALAAVEEALALEPSNTTSLTLKAGLLEEMGETEAADTLRRQVKQLKRELWQRQVEAEARGQHEIMGKATRPDKS